MGFIVQCVPENEGAYANAVEGKPYPSWANPAVNLNLQTISIEIEGYAANIHITMPRGSPQWKALCMLIADVCRRHNIPVDRIHGHKEVSVYRSDPGQLNLGWIKEDVTTLLQGEEDDMFTDTDRATLNSIGTTVANIYQHLQNITPHIVNADTECSIILQEVAEVQAALANLSSGGGATADEIVDEMAERLAN